MVASSLRLSLACCWCVSWYVLVLVLVWEAEAFVNV